MALYRIDPLPNPSPFQGEGLFQRWLPLKGEGLFQRWLARLVSEAGRQR
jgi:hypothetical protein